MDKARETAGAILAPGTGMLVADAYLDTTIRRLWPLPPANPATTEEFVDLLLGATDLGNWISSVLLTEHEFDRTRTSPRARRSDDFPPITFGVRMDPARTRADETESALEGLADVRRAQAAHRDNGADFVEWRANLDPLDVERGQVHVDAAALARGAASSQAEDLLPVITIAMPDLAGHSTEVTQAVTGNALRELFRQVDRFEVDPTALVLRVNMVVAGGTYRRQATPDETARATLRLMRENVPPAVPGIAFLSGGQPLTQACANLGAIARGARAEGLPWRLTFAFSRALVTGAIQAWRDGDGSMNPARRTLVRDCRVASQALSPSGSVREPVR